MNNWSWKRIAQQSSTAKFLSPRIQALRAADPITKPEVARLPPQYRKFYKEWQSEATPVHWIPSKVKWTRNSTTGAVSIVRDRPIPVTYPHQLHDGLWGGEAVVEGMVKKAKYRCPVPRFWVPFLTRSVVYSEILDKYLAVTVTFRALRLIDEFEGFDAYLLKNPANELQSLLALKLKRRILLALVSRDFAHDNPAKRAELLEKYKDYILPMEEVEWYGLSLAEAKAKYDAELTEKRQKAIQPLKFAFRAELIEKLKAEKIQADGDARSKGPSSTDWLKKLNPFSKPEDVTSRP